jgi:hypothetical protein
MLSPSNQNKFTERKITIKFQNLEFSLTGNPIPHDALRIPTALSFVRERAVPNTLANRELASDNTSIDLFYPSSLKFLS